MSRPGLLLVFSDPGSGVSEEEFTDWYDNEHVPLRLDIPAFQSLVRWKAADRAQPAWAASYDLTSYEATLQPPYTTLADTRSEREKRIIQDLGVLERRTYELLDVPVPPPAAQFDPRKPSRFMTFVSMEVKDGGDEILNRWYDEEHVPMLSRVEGWLRSRRFILKDWTRTGVDAKADVTPVPKYLAVHEWESLASFETDEFRHATSTPWRMRLFEGAEVWDRRLFREMRTWVQE